MAQTLSQLRTLVSSLLALDLDNMDGQSPTAAQLTATVNFGIRSISRAIKQYDPSMTIVLVNGTQSYDLRSVPSRKVIEAKSIYINGNGLWDANQQRYGMWTLQEVERYCPTWRTDPAGTPSKAFQVADTLYLHSKPDAGTASGTTTYLAGTYLAADMVNVTDDAKYPDIPEELHECIARIGAVFASDPNVTEQEGLARITRYDQRTLEVVTEIRKRNEKQFAGWKTTSGSSVRSFQVV